jgi:hypothetical protein
MTAHVGGPSARGSRAIARVQAAVTFLAIAIAASAPLLPGRVLFFRDHALTFRRLFARAAEIYARGHLPLWDAYTGGGEALAANPNAMAFSPVFALFVAPIGFDLAYALFILAFLFVAAVSAFDLARTLGASRHGSWMAALVYALSGPLCSSNSLIPQYACIALGPLAIALAIEVARAPRKETIAVFALVLGIHVETGDPSLFLMDVVAFVAAIWTERRRHGLRSIPGPLAGAVLGAGLIALPVWLLLVLLARSSRGAGFSYELLSIFSLHPVRLLELVFPGLSGDPGRGASFFSSMMRDSRTYLPSVYLGAAALPIALFAIRAPRARPQMFAIAILAPLALGRFTPLHRALVAIVPGLSSSRYPEKYTCGMALAFSMISAIGFDTIAADPLAVRRRLRRMVWPALVALVAIGSIALVAMPEWTSSFLGDGVSLERARPYFAGAAVHGSLAAIAAVLAIGLFARGSLSRGGLALALTVVLAIDLATAVRPLFPTADRAIFDEPPIAKRVLADDPRPSVFLYDLYRRPLDPNATPADQTAYAMLRLSPGIGAMFDIRYVLDPDLNSLRPHEWIAISEAFPGLSESERIHLLAHLGTTHILVEAARTDVPGLRHIGTGETGEEPIHAFHIEGARPLFSLAHRIESRAEESTVKALAERGPEDAAIVAPTERAKLPSSFSPAPGRGTIEAVGFASGEVHATITSTVPALLVIAQSYDEGWRATVNGTPVRPIRADAILTAIPIGPGRSECQLIYEPSGVRIAAAVSGACASVIALLLVGPWLRRRYASGSIPSTTGAAP